jgi:CRISPR/Cas system CMR-associated protein Cmr1 (group 7 of RAMP superfamily)
MCFPPTLSEIDFNDTQLEESEFKEYVLKYIRKLKKEAKSLEQDKAKRHLSKSPNWCNYEFCVNAILSSQFRGVFTHQELWAVADEK